MADGVLKKGVDSGALTKLMSTTVASHMKLVQGSLFLGTDIQFQKLFV
ncbi:hypothetical protein [Thiolapillus sp.]